MYMLLYCWQVATAASSTEDTLERQLNRLVVDRLLLKLGLATGAFASQAADVRCAYKKQVCVEKSKCLRAWVAPQEASSTKLETEITAAN